MTLGYSPSSRFISVECVAPSRDNTLEKSANAVTFQRANSVSAYFRKKGVSTWEFGPIAPGLTPDGDIDIAGTMQAVHDVIEGWIREYPEQWLWIHRRWRPDDTNPTSKREALGLAKAKSGLGG